MLYYLYHTLYRCGLVKGLKTIGTKVLSKRFLVYCTAIEFLSPDTLLESLKLCLAICGFLSVF